MAQGKILWSTHALETLVCNQEGHEDRYHREVVGEIYDNGDPVFYLSPTKPNGGSAYNGTALFAVETIARANYKLSKTRTSDKPQIADFNKITPVSEETDQRNSLRAPHDEARNQPEI